MIFNIACHYIHHYFSQIVLSQEPQDGEETTSTNRSNMTELDNLRLISDTKLVPRRSVLFVPLY